jgi:uncharacterized membrane protein
MFDSPPITNDAVILGILLVILALVFKSATSANPLLQRFYTYVPPIMLCYFLPGILGSIGLFSAKDSSIYFVASRYLLPACLVLLCLSVDLKGVLNLGPKALIMFFTGTFGIVIGGPIAYLIVGAIAPSVLVGEGNEAVWRGMTTIAGSWIGGGANQTAMKEIFQVGDDIFSALIPIDVLFGYAWLAVLLFFAGRSEQVDSYLKADNSAVKSLEAKMTAFSESVKRIPSFDDTMMLLAVGFGFTALAHFSADLLVPFLGTTFPEWLAALFGGETKGWADWLAWMSLTSKFFWLAVLATLGGVLASFTRLRELEGAGASRIGTAFLYVLIAAIGMKMDISKVFENPGLLLIGAIWISIHAILIMIVAKLIKAPLFLAAVGSQANVGGAASAPIIASAFNPTLAPVGVLLAVFGYVVGTFGAWLCGQLLRLIAGA